MLGVGLHQKFDGQVWVNFFEVIHHWESLHWDCIGLLWSLLKYWKRKKLLDLVSNANYVFTPNEPFPSFKKKLTGASPGLRNCNIARRIPLVWHSKVELPSAINLLIFLNCCFVMFFFFFFFLLLFFSESCFCQTSVLKSRSDPSQTRSSSKCTAMKWVFGLLPNVMIQVSRRSNIWRILFHLIMLESIYFSLFLFFSFSFFFFLFLSFQNKPVLLGLGDAL